MRSNSPPPWYYTVRALGALRERRQDDAIEAALRLAESDAELGTVIALAAASRAQRSDLVERFKPVVMGNPVFQQFGILPRIGQRVREFQILQLMRIGLLAAGVPTDAVDRPFKPDGSPA